MGLKQNQIDIWWEDVEDASMEIAVLEKLLKASKEKMVYAKERIEEIKGEKQ